MNLPYPEDAVRSVQPPEGMEAGRFSNRYLQYKKLIEVTDTILSWGVEKLAPELMTNAPAKLDEAVQRRDGKAVMVRAVDWKHLLTQAPLNYPADQVQISIP